ncbi:MAG: hypothetical protein LBI80_00990 [Endomicrobium sp.]|nr:hypothetical protein [Endomicrobium sp.]
MGETNIEGEWEYKVVKSKTIKGKIVAKGFITQNFNVSPIIGSDNIKKITLISKTSLPIDEDGASISKTRVKTTKENLTREQGKKDKSLDQKTNKITTKKDEEQIIVCSYCGYANVIPKGRKLRFCLNCAKPLKY